eukprot:3150133-Rhodomonas_salina.1
MPPFYYARPATDLGYAAAFGCAVSGTDVGYAATRSTQTSNLWSAPLSANARLRNVRYWRAVRGWLSAYARATQCPY